MNTSAQLTTQQSQELICDMQEQQQARATLAFIFSEENRLRRDGFLVVAGCLAMARMELLREFNI